MSLDQKIIEFVALLRNGDESRFIASIQERTTGRYYNYVLMRPDGMVFYVGEGTGNRINEHEWEARTGIQSYKCDVIRGIWREGDEIIKQKIAFHDSKDDARILESLLIRFFEVDGLTNQHGIGGGVAKKDPVIVDYAKKIARLQKYPVLVKGLQPVPDYTYMGNPHVGLETKLTRELQEFQEASTAYWEGGKKTDLHVMHEAADLYYYCRQIEYQTDQHRWSTVFQSIRWDMPNEWRHVDVRKAAHAKYGWRSEQEGNKNEAYEIDLIRRALSSPPKDREPVTRLNFVCSKRLKDALYAAQAQEMVDNPDVSLAEILEREALNSPYLQRLLSKEDQHA